MNTSDKYKQFKKESEEFLKKILNQEVSECHYKKVISTLRLEVDNNSERETKSFESLKRFEYKQNQLSLAGLSRLYGFHKETIRKYLEPIWSSIDKGERRYFTFEQAKTIIDYLGDPDILIKG